MICEKCSTELPDFAVACYSCGTMTEAATFVRPLAGSPTVVTPRAKSKAPIIAGTAIGGVAVVIVVALIAAGITYGILKSGTEQKAREDSPRSTPDASIPKPKPTKTTASATVGTQTEAPQQKPEPSAAPLPRQQLITIFNGSEVVGADSGKWWSFTVDESGAHVIGRFSAEGGLRGELECYIADEDEAQNIAKGLNGQAYYQSGKVTTGKIDIRLGPGRYVVLFRNSSPWTQRTVRGTITAE